MLQRFMCWLGWHEEVVDDHAHLGMTPVEVVIDLCDRGYPMKCTSCGKKWRLK